MEHPAVWLVAVNTLLHEIGVPVPLMPTLLFAGAGSGSGGAHPLTLIAVVVAGTLAGNLVWFAVGRRYGSGALKFVCRVSLSPAVCASRAEDTFGRWGWSSLVVGRFIPGVSLVTPPLAGALGMKLSTFVALTAAGAALWSLVVVAAGILLHEEIDALVQGFDTAGREVLPVIIAVVALYVVRRWWKRERRAPKLDVTRSCGGH